MSEGFSGLPIDAVLDDITRALSQHRVCVLTAEPGAGKTTVVPLWLLSQPWLAGQKIIMLEPRRLAARASAARMAAQLGESVGATVGVVTRDDRRVSASTRIEVVTEGVLTRKLQNDPSLSGYGLVIFDEFHERNQQGDLALALLLDARSAFELDTAILVMSATIDANAVAQMLPVHTYTDTDSDSNTDADDTGDARDGADSGVDVVAPVVECPGRTFPIELSYRARSRKQRIEDSVTEAVRELIDDRSFEGDILVFLPGKGEISRCQEKLVDLTFEGVAVLALHGSLSLQEQDIAVSPSGAGQRKVVLSTDIAESSLTVEGIRAVIDSGLARTPRFDAKTGMTRLTTVSISRASADQRAGRAGRMAPGRAIRLWSKLEHGTRPAFTPPELSTIDLCDFRLELANWGTTNPQHLKFMDPIPAPAWKEAGVLLESLGAIDSDGRITKRGKSFAHLPLHPRLAAIVRTAETAGYPKLGCLIAAVLDERDVLSRKEAESNSDLSYRLGLVADAAGSSGGRGLRRFVAQRWLDLARRIGAKDKPLKWSHTDNSSRVGVFCAAGFPDRIAQRRNKARGRFRMRTGTGLHMHRDDVLAEEDFIVALNLDGKRSEAKVRLGVAVELDELLQAGFECDSTYRVQWDKKRNDVVTSVIRHLGSLELGVLQIPNVAGEAVTKELLDYVHRRGLKVLTWTENSTSLAQRSEFYRSLGREDDWPDLSQKWLLRNRKTWLEPLLVGATSRADLEVLSVAVALDTILGYERRRRLDAALPTHLVVGKRRILIDYTSDPPMVKSRAQDFFGLDRHPVIAGDIALLVELLSPANRPIQRTCDLDAFWQGSWSEVRKDMAGRYPKHDWPINPKER